MKLKETMRRLFKKVGALILVLHLKERPEINRADNYVTVRIDYLSHPLIKCFQNLLGVLYLELGLSCQQNP